MDIDIDTIEELYGKDILKKFGDNLDNINLNINYLKFIGIKSFIEVFERTTPIFFDDYEIFKNKIDKVINILGKNFVEEIENNIGIVGELYDKC